jgi:hypothetical protein
MSLADLLAFTVPIPSWLGSGLSFVHNHLIFWIIPLGLVFEIRYLGAKERRRQIAMSRWGEATREGQPLFFVLLWLLHLTATAMFSVIFCGYLLDLIGVQRS